MKEYVELFPEPDILNFEEEYLNEEKNGKGKEYDKYNNKIFSFEGEYLNDKRIGKEMNIDKMNN